MIIGNTANRFLVDSLQEILKNGMNTEYLPHSFPVRTKYADGSSAHYITIGPKMVVYDTENGDYPINTYRAFPIKKSIAEMRWIYQMQSNVIADAESLGVNWWKPWDIGDGTIGYRYGHTVRRYNLMTNLIDTFTRDPLSRRKVMSLWQEQEFLEETKGRKPCAHTTVWDLNIRPDGVFAVTLTLYQRSMDLLVTSSINAFQYWILGEALMAHLRALTGRDYQIVKVRHDIGDVHIYDRHLEAAHEVLQTTPADKRDIWCLAPDEIPVWENWTENDFTIIVPKIPRLTAPLELAI